ncbi:MAG: dockerin type I repeat-containing protein [Bacteroidaceae bacterium]|nr:dockerin type I repeat-containing protein [Bacteroidaceae bacterium]
MVKKLLLLFALALTAATWTTMDARWVIGERKNASQIHAGDTVVLQFAAKESQSDRYLQVADESYTDRDLIIGKGLGIGSAAIITFEEGPNDIRTDAPTLYIKFVENDMYIKAKYYVWDPPGMTLTSSIDEAAPWQVLNCGEPIPWYDEGNSYTHWEFADDAITDDNSVGFSVSTSETGFAYLSYWVATGNQLPITWAYCTGNQWNAYSVTYEKDLRDDLQQLIDSYTSDAEYLGGTDPGFLSQEEVDAYENLLQSALILCYDGTATDEQLKEAYDGLKEARANMGSSLVPMTEGYYYILNDDENIVNNGVTPKGMYLDEDRGSYYYGPFDPEDIRFVYKVSPYEDDKWTIENLKDGTYLGIATAFCGTFAPTTDPSNYVDLYCWSGTGSWCIKTYNGTRTWTMTAHGSPGDSDEKTDYVWAYNGREVEDVAHKTWGWRFQRVSDDLMEGFMDAKQQADRTRELRELVSEGKELYANLFNYTMDADGLIKVVDGDVYDNPPSENCQISGTLKGDGSNYLYMAGKYEYLIDEFDSTYMKCSDYIQVDISQTPVQTVTFKWETRCASMQYGTTNQHTWGVEERPNAVEIYATNDTVNGGEWVKVGANSFGTVTDEDRANPFPAVTYTLDMGEPYKFIRYVVRSNAKGGSGCTLSFFQIYGAIEDKTTSQYYTTEGMKELADALKALTQTSTGIVNADTATDEDIQNMKDAIAAVRELYADTTALSKLIAESEVLLQGIVVGDGMGELSDEALATALRAAIDDARATAFTTPISAPAVKAAEKSVGDAKAAFLAGLKTFEVGKWYFITNLDTDRMGDAGAEDAMCGGNAIYLNSKYPGSSVTKWGLFDPASMTLNADGNPKAMWQFVPVEGTEYYAIRNLYNGYYLGDYAGDNINLPISETPVPYDVAYIGNAQFSLIPKTKANAKGWSLWPEGFECDVVCHDPGTPASAWTFVEVVPEEQEAISISDFAMNLIDVMTVPYDVKDIAEYNDDVHTYAIRKITQYEVEPTEEGGTAELCTEIELYEKNEFKAGEPFIIGLGNWQAPEDEAPFEPYDLIIPFPTEQVDHSYTFVANGIVGGLHSTKPEPTTAISTGKNFIPFTGTFDAQTGVIDPSTYRGEVEGVETVATLVITGDLNRVPELTEPADVNGDGFKNTADVVAVYTFIEKGTESGFTREAADVNRDGNVNTADVVAIYTAIIGGEGAGSRAFKVQMSRLLK